MPRSGIVHLCQCPVAQALVRALVVVELEVVMQSCLQGWNVIVVVEVDVFVLDGAPQALDENVVQGSAAAIHADQDASSFQMTNRASCLRHAYHRPKVLNTPHCEGWANASFGRLSKYSNVSNLIARLSFATEVSFRTRW